MGNTDRDTHKGELTRATSERDQGCGPSRGGGGKPRKVREGFLEERTVRSSLKDESVFPRWRKLFVHSVIPLL